MVRSSGRVRENTKSGGVIRVANRSVEGLVRD